MGFCNTEDGIIELEPIDPYSRLLLHRLADIFGYRLADIFGYVLVFFTISCIVRLKGFYLLFVWCNGDGS